MILLLFSLLFVEKTNKKKYIEPEIAHDRSELIAEWSKFISEADKKHIKFTKTLYLEFSHITEENTIGICYYGYNFRTIRIDVEFWNHATDPVREMLMLHELSHCLCTRDHDFNDGEKYLDSKYESFLKIFHIKLNGIFEDGCPKSVMYPVIVSHECAIKYRNYYIKEAFNRCVAW